MHKVAVALVLAIAACSPQQARDATKSAQSTGVSSAPAQQPPRRLPTAAWATRPTSDDFARCQPTSTDVRDGEVLLRCRVGASGALENCEAKSSGDRRLRDWAMCVAKDFRTLPGYRSMQVEVPLRWTTRS